MNRVYKVLLPKELWRQHHHSLDSFIKAVYIYMEKYPQYEVLEIEQGFIICHLKGALI